MNDGRMKYGCEQRNSFWKPWRLGNLIRIGWGEVLKIPEFIHRLAASYVAPGAMTGEVDILVL